MTIATLWQYQKERFPLVKTVPLLAVFSAASICVSAVLSDRPLPGVGAFLAGFTVALLLFFQMRVCDEYKDLEDDKRYRPNRPIPRGLISLKTILTLGVFSLPVSVIAVWAWHPPAVWLLALVWTWLAAMTAEFGVPAWLKARPVIYLISHMAIMPLIDLLLTGMEWLPGGGASGALWMFLALSFVNGCVLEIGRKLWAPEHEIVGVDSYSRTWGPKRGAMIWSACVFVSFVLLVGLGRAMGVFWITLGLGLFGLGFCLSAARTYYKTPTPKAEKLMDTVSGIWILACYSIAGFVPVIMRAI